MQGKARQARGGQLCVPEGIAHWTWCQSPWFVWLAEIEMSGRELRRQSKYLSHLPTLAKAAFRPAHATRPTTSLLRISPYSHPPGCQPPVGSPPVSSTRCL